MNADAETATDPFVLFAAWMTEAEAAEPNDPNAMTLATVDGDGLPDARMVLLKGVDPAFGFAFYTNGESAKGRQLEANPRAALCFYWKSVRRQVRVRGDVLVAPPAETDAYFNSRARGSRLGAWASQQSRPLESRFVLEKAVAHYAAKFGSGDIPRPPYWISYRLQPRTIEFWQDQKFRLHDRFLFTRQADGSWIKGRLYP